MFSVQFLLKERHAHAGIVRESIVNLYLKVEICFERKKCKYLSKRQQVTADRCDVRAVMSVSTDQKYADYGGVAT